MMVQESLTFAEKPTHYHIPVYKVALVRESTHSQLQRPQVRTAPTLPKSSTRIWQTPIGNTWLLCSSTVRITSSVLTL